VYYLPAGKKSHCVWWPGYVGQRTVVFDDFYGSFPFTEFLKLVDSTPYKVRTHDNVWAEFVSTRLIITSNRDPLLWYKSHLEKFPECVVAYKRRLNHVFYYSRVYDANDECGAGLGVVEYTFSSTGVQVRVSGSPFIQLPGELVNNENVARTDSRLSEDADVRQPNPNSYDPVSWE